MENLSNVVIGMFVLPTEIDQFQNTVMRLKDALSHINTLTFTVDATLVLSDELVEIGDNGVYIEEKFRFLETFLQGNDLVKTNFKIETGDTILGCVSKRRSVANNLTTNDVGAIFLDCDIVFPRNIFFYIEKSIKSIQNTGIDMFVLTPQIIRIWDTTWDVLVNEDFIEKDHEFYEQADLYEIVGKNEYMQREVSISNINKFKFSGGWMTFLSKTLLEEISIPDSFGHYGLEDTYIMACMGIMKSYKIPVEQFLMKNIIVGEDYKYRPPSYLKSIVNTKDRRSEFLDIANSAFFSELNRFEGRFIKKYLDK